MRDFTCCGLTLASLHDVLQHFEEVHAGAPPSRPSQPTTSGALQPTMGTATSAGITPGQTQTNGEPATHTQLGFHPRSGSAGAAGPFRQQRLGSDGFNRTNLSTVHDMDTLEDMEMDDIGDGLATIEETPSQFSQQAQFNQNQVQLQPLNVNLANTMQNHQGLRTSTPTTPSASQQFNLQNNPTVSSVNTPTLGTVPMQHNLTSPDSSHPSTPAELDMDFANNFGMGMQGMQGMDMNFGGVNFATGMPGFDGTIDQPGKRLFSKQGAGLSQQQLQAAFKNYQMGGDQNDLSRRLQQQQLANGANVPQFPFPEEVKPFRCPVIGCEKAYKNQNGLKYHKQVCLNIDFNLTTDIANMYIARPPEPTAEGERGWHLLDRRPSDFHTLSRHRRHGEREALSLRDVRKAVQEPQRSQVPSRTRPEMQSRVGTAVRRTACPAGAECRCECCRRRHDGYGYVHVLNRWLTVVGIASRFSTIAPHMIPTVRIRHLHGVLRHRPFCVFLLGVSVY